MSGMPWDDEYATYASIAAAEERIKASGYVRDNSRGVWRNGETGKTAKVVHNPEDNYLFVVQWG